MSLFLGREGNPALRTRYRLRISILVTSISHKITDFLEWILFLCLEKYVQPKMGSPKVKTKNRDDVVQ